MCKANDKKQQWNRNGTKSKQQKEFQTFIALPCNACVHNESLSFPTQSFFIFGSLFCSIHSSLISFVIPALFSNFNHFFFHTKYYVFPFAFKIHSESMSNFRKEMKCFLHVAKTQNSVCKNHLNTLICFVLCTFYSWFCFVVGIRA